MTLKVKQEPIKFVHVMLKCNKCGELFVSKDTHNIRGGSEPCEMCGEHGGVDIDCTCPRCGNSSRVILNSW